MFEPLLARSTTESAASVAIYAAVKRPEVGWSRPGDGVVDRSFHGGTWDFSAITISATSRTQQCGKPAVLLPPRLQHPVQAKLKDGTVQDPFKRGADDAGDQAEVPADKQTAAGGAVQEVLRSHGEPLDAATRALFEPRFGQDFSLVRVHTGSLAERSAREINARAYTVGHNIVFDSGGFAPGSSEGRHLLAHELTHVLQQQRGQRAVPQAGFTVSTPADPGERQADATADAVMRHGSIPPLTHVLPNLQRKCKAAELGAPKPDCAPSQQGVVGWQLLFKVGCDELLPGEADKINMLRPGRQLKIHGFASREGDAAFNADLSCHRANVVADLVRSQRADCPVIGIFKHGASPVSGPGVVPDANPLGFWRSVIIEEIKPALESGEQWLDPNSNINQGRALLNRAKTNPTQANLDVVAARRGELKTWLEGVGKSLAPANAELSRRNLDDYRRFFKSAEDLWIAIDQLLALQKHADAARDTYDGWAKGTGSPRADPHHAKNVPAAAKYHIDIFGEGYFKGAINIGMAQRTSTTGVYNTRVPNLVYRKFSGSDAKVNKIPIADHTADLVTAENGPIRFPGLAEEIARIIAPGGTIILFNPDSEEFAHDKVAKATGGTVKKVRGDATIQTTIVVPGGP